MNSSLKQMSINCVYVWGYPIPFAPFDILKKVRYEEKSHLTLLEIFFTPHKAKARLRVHVTLDVQLTTQNLRTAEEDAHLA